MRRFVPIVAAAAALACARADTDNRDSIGETASAAGTVVVDNISLASLSGRWSVRVMPEMGDSTVATYDLNATADTAGWTITMPGRDTVSLHVMAPMGDSVVFHAGPGRSLTRGTVNNVSTTTVLRLRDGRLVGTQTERASVQTADSVARFRIEGMRM
jgi:hypothetical protein